MYFDEPAEAFDPPPHPAIGVGRGDRRGHDCCSSSSVPATPRCARPRRPPSARRSERRSRSPAGSVLDATATVTSTNDLRAARAEAGEPEGPRRRRAIADRRPRPARPQLGTRRRGNLYASLLLRPRGRWPRRRACRSVLALAAGGGDRAAHGRAPCSRASNGPTTCWSPAPSSPASCSRATADADWRLRWLVAGIGVNLASSPGTASAYPAPRLRGAGSIREVTSPTPSGRSLAAVARRSPLWRSRQASHRFRAALARAGGRAVGSRGRAARWATMCARGRFADLGDGRLDPPETRRLPERARCELFTAGELVLRPDATARLWPAVSTALERAPPRYLG